MIFIMIVKLSKLQRLHVIDSLFSVGTYHPNDDRVFIGLVHNDVADLIFRNGGVK